MNMNNKLFVYKRVKPFGHEKDFGSREYYDAFNVDLVIRTITFEDETVLVLLNDTHERLSEVPMTNKSGVITGYKNQKVTSQTEIVLSKEDGARLYRLYGEQV